MRYLLLLAVLGSCEKASEDDRCVGECDTVVLEDVLTKQTKFMTKPTAKAASFAFGCDILTVDHHVAIRCLEGTPFLARFRCDDLSGPNHAIEFVYQSQWKIYCI